MEFKVIIARALQIREKYAALENEKYGREWNKEEIALGFVGDVGDLAKLVSAKEGVRETQEVDTKMAHELSDCLWSILILADKYGIDLEKNFLGTMDELDNRLQNK